MADRLAKGIETFKPYQNAVLASVLLVLVATLSYGWWVRRSTEVMDSGWDAFYAALGKVESGPGGFDDAMSDFDDIIAANPKTHLSQWTAAVAADLHLQMGCDQLFRNKPNANQELKRATELYEKLRAETRSPRLQQRAIFGLARATEAKGTDLEKAKSLYEELNQKWPEGVYAAAATQRAEDLSEPATLEMYDKFAKFDPKPAFLDGPGIPGERPAFDLDSLPDGPSSTNSPSSEGTMSDGLDLPEGNIFPTPLIDLKETGVADEPDTTGDQPSTTGDQPDTTGDMPDTMGDQPSTATDATDPKEANE